MSIASGCPRPMGFAGRWHRSLASGAVTAHRLRPVASAGRAGLRVVTVRSAHSAKQAVGGDIPRRHRSSRAGWQPGDGGRAGDASSGFSGMASAAGDADPAQRIHRRFTAIWAWSRRCWRRVDKTVLRRRENRHRWPQRPDLRAAFVFRDDRRRLRSIPRRICSASACDDAAAGETGMTARARSHRAPQLIRAVT